MKFLLDEAAYNALPEALRAYYQRRDDGKYVLQVEGAVPAEKLAEFRDNNVRLQNELKAYKDLAMTPEQVAELKKKKDDIDAGRSSSGKTVAEIVEERVGDLRKQSAEQIAALQKKLEGTTSDLARLKITDAALKKGTELGLRPSAADDLAARVTGVFALEDGKVIAKNPDGTPRYGKNAEPLAIDEYVQGLVDAAPHLFEPSSGTRASGSNGGNGNKGPVVNPWKKETHNVTRQGEIYKQNPDLARKLAAEAGVRLP